jgi:hypothetical protein
LLCFSLWLQFFVSCPPHSWKNWRQIFHISNTSLFYKLFCDACHKEVAIHFSGLLPYGYHFYHMVITSCWRTMEWNLFVFGTFYFFRLGKYSHFRWQLKVLAVDLAIIFSPAHPFFKARLQNCEKRLLAPSYLSVRPSAWNNSAPNGRIFMKF